MARESFSTSLRHWDDKDVRSNHWVSSTSCDSQVDLSSVVWSSVVPKSNVEFKERPCHMSLTVLSLKSPVEFEKYSVACHLNSHVACRFSESLLLLYQLYETALSPFQF